MNLSIPDAALDYLMLQRGALDDMRGYRQLWVNKYCEILQSEYDSIEPYLPKRCDSVLDVGSGMGGIDILLNQHYGNGLRVTLLDGVNDPPKMVAHAATFNSMSVAKEFQLQNGVQLFDYIDANDPKRRPARFYDLIVSFKSWCFHTPPSLHLDVVRAACRPGTVIILDIRASNPHWFSELLNHFEHATQIHRGIKFTTEMFVAP